MSDFETAVSFVLKNEGGLSTNPKDPGGITKFGISLKLLQSCVLKYDFNRDGLVDEKEIRDLTVDNAKFIYLNEFWYTLPFEKIQNQQLCTYLFDMIVNMGQSQAVKLTQRALWAFYKKRYYIIDDGILGSRTLDELNQAGELLLLPLMSERAGYYRLLAAVYPEIHKGELNGWLNRCYTI